MKEYKVIPKRVHWELTQNRLNKAAQEGWKVITSYCAGSWFVLEREKEVCSKCKR